VIAAKEGGQESGAGESATWLSDGLLARDKWRREIAFWRSAGVTHITAQTSFNSGHHKRIEGRTLADHLAAITRYRTAVAELL
jgi:hypothetical protein